MYLLAEKNSSKHTFDPTELLLSQKDLDKQLWSLEYGDIAGGIFQVWEYPSGKIYNVVSDRELKGDKYKDYYGTPDPGIWQPKLVYIRTDKDLVSKEKARFKDVAERASVVGRIVKNIFRHRSGQV